VRDLSLELLRTSDAVRDEALPKLGLYLEDRAGSTHVSTVPSKK
jgi:hypothetical protein